jgi:hypothetical protein
VPPACSSGRLAKSSPIFSFAEPSKLAADCPESWFPRLSNRRAMNLKKFLKPDWRKIVIFIVLLIVFLPWKSGIIVGELYWRAWGFPWPILAHKLIYQGLTLDLIFWYLISCFIIWICDKLKKKV